MLSRLSLILALLFALPALAETVRLTTPDGDIFIEGKLLSFSGELFRVETEFGAVTIDAGGLRCSGEGCPDPADLIARTAVGGPPDMVHRLFPAILEAFAERMELGAFRTFNDDTEESWELREAGTGRPVAVFAVRSMDDEAVEPQLAAKQITIGFGRLEASDRVRQDVVALDALVPAVAPDNPRAVLTQSQLQALFAGETDSWDRLGAPGVPVSLHAPKDLDQQVRRLLSDGISTKATRHEDLAVLADTVAADPGAIGLVPYSALGNAIPVIVSGACGLAIPATRDTIRAEDYPVTHPLYLARLGADQPKLVRDFIAFARSPEAQPLVRAAGFVDQAIGRISFERQGGRIANAVLTAGDDPAATAEVRDMIAALLGGERLTLTFRFRDGSSDLDPQSVSNIQRLADAISAGAFDGHRMQFVGFSDGVGEKAANLRLSERRARSVRRAVSARVASNTVDFEVAAFGELMPMACDDTPWGGQVNRRVEVWVNPLEVTR